ncbi:gamma-glutamylcyclotransferase [Flagellimonas hymeniacidonis]|uniref:Gamma-glutamylcyclotransferase n=1 Tax=Flagellimonas hymeniacidonis TaxID=2603628 RepID=A0A5C8VA76_9FLAO|nr:gamma-glutamylcyclotransferase family protein [Flagellimonas hymeniacidonis]TXN38316.1 gamma-glutamylcyclotransferase [Flagellimonas hymeniacidonis]
MKPKTELLFSYGTLQMEKVQLETYGRKLTGTKDALSGYSLGEIEIKNQEVLLKSNLKFHPIAIKTNNIDNRVKGHVYEITQEELMETDKYEVGNYKRVLEKFQSGKKAWVYVAKEFVYE